MAEGRGPLVYLAVPVYRGTRFVTASLRSMLDQTHREIRVQVSVDGNDAESAEACAPFLADERVRMTVQERQLGWVANMNWLIDAFEGDYFCYWQQDDHCEPTYLQKLVAAIEEHPGAAAAHSDLRWFGDSSDEVAMPSMVGFTQQRILAQVEALHWLPLRAVVTADALRQVAPIRGLQDSIAFSDYLFVLRLAIAGDLIRVPEVLYHKRSHTASASKNPSGDFHLSAREAWIELGLEIFSEVAPHFEERDWPRLAMVISDRLVASRPGRWSHYDPTTVSGSEPAQFASDLSAAFDAWFGVTPRIAGGGATSEEEGPATRLTVEEAVAPAISAAELMGDGAPAAPVRGALVEMLRRGGRHTLDCSARGVADALLVQGWGQPEDWGTWSDGRLAWLWLPIPDDGGTWRIQLQGQGYVGAPGAPATPRLIVSRERRILLDRTLTPGSTLPVFEVSADAGAGDGIVLRLDLPDATAPSAHGDGDDERLLTLGLEKIGLARKPGSRTGEGAGRALTRLVGVGLQRVTRTSDPGP